MNYLYYGDNLHVLRERIPDETVDLIYLDPPFNSARNYNLLFKQVKGDPSPAQIMAFEDTWTWSPLLYEQFREDDRCARLFPLVAALYEILGPSEMMAYVLMMAPRLLELHRVLKRTGSLYLHCDPVASHYLKIILDVVFGPDNFKSEVVWKRTSAHSSAKRFGPVHDTILYYSQSSEYTWNPQYLPLSDDYVATFFDQVDDKGRRYKRMDLTGAGTRNGPSGDPWRGIDVRAKGRHWAYLPSELDKLDEEGRIHWPAKDGGMPRLKQYPEDIPGVALQDVITDIRPIHNLAAERRGYPTQKPLALLERILAASSREGDTVLDPFCGCGTALVAAERMGRKWIGIDVTYLAINEVIYRLNTERVEGKPLEYQLVGSPTDALGAQKLFEQTAHQNHKPFEQFCVTLVHGEYREKKGADRGIDGVINLWDARGKLRRIVIQVKGGNALTLSAVRDFASVIRDNDAVMGLVISMREPTAEMRLVAEQQGFADWHTDRKYPRMQLRTVRQLLEHPREPFEIPESYRVPKSTGLGALVESRQESLDLDS